VVFPCTVYTALMVAAVFVPAHTAVALFAIAAVALALLLIGIHNAWDTVTHLVVSDTEGR
jgi:hypothetical protein